MSEWLNTTIRKFKSDDIDKPCHKLGFCPYGQLVEEFPLHPEFEEQDLNKVAREGKLDTGYNCKVFGHDCPVFYHAERIMEDDMLNL